MKMKNAAPKEAAPRVTLLSIHYLTKFSQQHFIFYSIALSDAPRSILGKPRLSQRKQKTGLYDERQEGLV